MATYESCYTIAEDVRLGINDYSDALHKGTETGAYDNKYIIKKINQAHRQIYAKLLTWIPHEFLGVASLTGVNSVYTLPWDFGSIVFFKDDNGIKVDRIDPSKLKLVSSTGSASLYYRKGRTLVLDEAGVTSVYTLYYIKKARDLHYGQAASGSGAGDVRLSATYAKKVDDYYNNLALENVTTDAVDTITDYTGSTRAATVTNVWTENDWYGVVSDIPEEAHTFIAPLATLLIKAEAVQAQDRPTKEDFANYWNSLYDIINGYYGAYEDEDPSELFYDQEIF